MSGIAIYSVSYLLGQEIYLRWINRNKDLTSLDSKS